MKILKQFLKYPLVVTLLITNVIIMSIIVANSQESQDTRTHAQVNGTNLSLTIYLHGIGAGGDALNLTNNSHSTKKPFRTERAVKIMVYTTENQLVLTKQGKVFYNAGNGTFTGVVNIGDTLRQGNYIVKVSSPNYLVRRIPATVYILQNSSIKLPPVSLVAGDVNNDNSINILDYNLLMGCYSDLLRPTFCNSERRSAANLSDDSKVNAMDLNLLLREFSVGNGD